MVKGGGDGGGGLFEGGPAFVVGERPPILGLLDWDQRRARRFGTAERRLRRQQALALPRGAVAIVARHAKQDPTCTRTEKCVSTPLAHPEAGHRFPALAPDFSDPFHPPPPPAAPAETD